MKEVPNVISDKDLLYIKDMLNFNIVLCKKLNYYSYDFDDELGKLLEKSYNLHMNQYKELLDILD